MDKIKSLILFLVVFSASVYYAGAQNKIKGVSFVGANAPISEADIEPIVSLNANWVTIMPYAFIDSSGVVLYNTKWQWWGEKTDGVKKTLLMCQEKGLKVMIKPHVWINNAYTGDYRFYTEKEWSAFEQSYAKYIINFALIAKENNVQLFCIGTEWRSFIKHRPLFWERLIQKIRKVYSGKLTYAANWDDYKQVPFWNKLDFIGVDAYFPISINRNPELKELIKGWQHHEQELAKFSDQVQRKIIFTEVGYRSLTGATVKPWEHHQSKAYNSVIQEKAYRALFQVIWKKKWFQGMFLWKWFHNHTNQGGKGNTDFTPQNKPAEKYIQEFWGQN